MNLRFGTKRWAFGAAACVIGTAVSTGSAGGIRIGINLAPPPPPPPPARHEVVVVDYDSYCVGYRHNLYGADWRLRNARIDAWRAQETLDTARHREGEIAVAVEDHEAIVAQYEKRIVESDAALAAARSAVGRGADDAAEARARLSAFEKRMRSAHEDLEAARTLRDRAGVEDAEHRIRVNQDAAAVAASDLRAAEGRMSGLTAAEAAAAELRDGRARLLESRDRLPRLREDLAAAHDEVFGAQGRLDAAMLSVATAMHDRDEALWLLHRDDIYVGRAGFEGSGFHVDLAPWGGRPPADIEVAHAFYVRPASYWVEHPAEIEMRMAEVDRIGEMARIRQIQERHEGPRFAEVARYELSVPPERRRERFEAVAVERQRMGEDRAERELAAREHRAPRIPETERAQAHAMATKEQAEARAERKEARADAQAAETEARGEARAEEIKARGDARAKETEARADARAKVTEAKGEARSEKIEAKSEAKAEETKARTDARAKESDAKADRSTRTAPGSSRDARNSASNPGNNRATRDDKKSKKDNQNQASAN